MAGTTDIDFDIETSPDAFGRLLGYQVRRLSLLVMADLSTALEPLQLKPADASILLAIKTSAGSNQSSIGKMLGIQRANMAPLIAALFKRGFIERKPMDGRSHILRLSAQGELIVRKAMAIMKLHEDRLFGHLKPRDRRQLASQLRSLWEKSR